MKYIDVKVIHTINNLGIDVGISEGCDVNVFNFMANFLSKGILALYGTRKESMLLDNDKRIWENGVGNNDMIQVMFRKQVNKM